MEPTVVDVDKALDEAGLRNAAVRDYVRHWAAHLTPDRIEVVSAADDARLVDEALAAGEILPAGDGLYYSRSYSKDTARSEERTIVATSREEDRGVYNNWRHTDEIRPVVEGHMAGAMAGRTMYVIPYLMAPEGSPLEKYAAGVEITDNRTVCLHMIRMARVGIDLIDGLAEPDHFVRAVHVTGDLPNLGQGTPDDKRYFVTVADERTILHFGSSYGGNALLGKIAHGLRQAAYDGWRSGEFLSEQFMLLGIHDKETGKTWHVCGGFPSASGKTNLAMTLAPDALGDRYHVSFYGDDIAWLWVDPETGDLLALNPENGVFGVAKDTNEKTNPTALHSIRAGSRALFTNVAYNEDTHEVWWEGRTPHHPDPTGWVDWKGERISDRNPDEAGDPWAHPNSRFTTTLANVPNVAADYDEPKGVKIDAIIFGGRTRDREPLVRAITDLPEGVYDGLTLGAEATVRRRGRRGQAPLRPDVDAALHVLRRGPLRAALARHRRCGQGAADLRARQLVPARPRGRPLPLAGLPREPPRPPLALPVQGRRGQGPRDGRRRHPDRGGARPRGPRPAPARPRPHPRHRRRPVAPGDDPPDRAPRAVPEPARVDLGGPPPRHHGARPELNPEPDR